MLQSVPGSSVHAARDVGDAPVHQLSLCFERNRFRVKRQDPPWKIVRAFPLTGAGALVHLHNVSGGVLSGDRLALDIEVEAGAAAQVTTTGATRLYRHRAGAADSEHHMRFLLDDGARLEYLPDALIPYSGSRHIQNTEISLGRGSALFYWEVLAPGRLAAGERFAFERLQVQTRICAGGHPVLCENFLLEPSRKDIAATARMAEYSHAVMFCALHEGSPPGFWRALEGALNDIAGERTRRGEALWGASTLASDGVVVRGLSRSGRFIQDALFAFWKTSRVAITGEDAPPPRKIY